MDGEMLKDFHNTNPPWRRGTLWLTVCLGSLCTSRLELQNNGRRTLFWVCAPRHFSAVGSTQPMCSGHVYLSDGSMIEASDSAWTDMDDRKANRLSMQLVVKLSSNYKPYVNQNQGNHQGGYKIYRGDRPDAQQNVSLSF